MYYGGGAKKYDGTTGRNKQGNGEVTGRKEQYAYYGGAAGSKED